MDLDLLEREQIKNSALRETIKTLQKENAQLRAIAGEGINLPLPNSKNADLIELRCRTIYHEAKAKGFRYPEINLFRYGKNEWEAEIDEDSELVPGVGESPIEALDNLLKEVQELP